MNSGPSLRVLTLRVLDQVVRIFCANARAFDLLRQNYGALEGAERRAADLHYRIGAGAGGYSILRAGAAPLGAADDGELIFLLEKDLTLELQRRRRDLYFIHAAALALDGRAALLVAPSGCGKSTTAWGLLHHGFEYLSDELAPVDLGTLTALAYPHALCLKAEPPARYPLPRAILHSARTLHVPPGALPARILSGAAPVAALFFIEYRPGGPRAASAETISKSEATARLFAQALNPLAHTEDGLRAAAAIACHAACYRLRFSDLGSCCAAIRDEMLGLAARESALAAS